MKRPLLVAGMALIASMGWPQEVIFELEVGTEGRGLDAFVVNNAQAFEVDVFDPPPGFPAQGLELGPDTSGIWLADFLGTDYQLDVVWLDVGQWADETSGDDADGILTARGQSIDTDIRNAANAGYNIEREKDTSDNFGRGSLKIVSFFGDGTANTEYDQRRVNDGTVPGWQGMSFRVHGQQLSVVAWEPPEDGNVPPALEIDFNTPNTAVFWDATFPSGYAGISWASGMCQVVWFRVTDLSGVPAPEPPPAPDDFVIEAESGTAYAFDGPTDIIGPAQDVKAGDPVDVMVFPNDTDPAEDGVDGFTFVGGTLPEDLVGATEWAVYNVEATADQAGIYEVYFRGRNVNTGSANIAVRSNPDDAETNPFEGAGGTAFWDMETRLMRQTTAPAGLVRLNEGENTLTVASWESGFLLDQIQLEKTTAEAAFISGAFPATNGDHDVIYRLENELGLEVISVPDAFIADADPPRRAVYTPEILESGQIKLLVISSTVDPAALLDYYAGVNIPILVLDTGLMDEFQLGADGGDLPVELYDWAILDGTHPITEGFSGTVAVQDPPYDWLPGPMGFVSAPLAEGAVALAASPDDDTQITLAAAGAGAALADGSAAANRRVYMGIGDWNFGLDARNENMEVLFDAAVEWLVGGEVDVAEWTVY